MPPASAIQPVSDLASLPELDLAALAARGDAAAFRFIMERNNERLYRAARGIVRNESEAEDVVQEAYVRAFAKLSTFRGASSLATWLTRIVINEALGRVRRRRSTADLDILEKDPGATVVNFPGVSAELDPERNASRREIAGLLERAIDALPEAYRVVFILRAVEEMTVEETSAALGIPEATVKTRLHRARGLLRRTIQEEIGSVLSDAFPFGGHRCARTTAAVLARLRLDDTSNGTIAK